jgi:uncharacterized cysteine cluster protein YcgN (CxxCxxCC family)
LTPLVPRADAAEAVNDGMTESAPFWRTKRLSQMTRTEWESLCDGCGRCCLNKLEDIDTGATYFTNVACKLFDETSCRCKDYPRRKQKVPDCVKLTPRNVQRIPWLPPTCAYRLVAQGKDLYWWHHLKSGSRGTVHEAGVSVRGRTLYSEENVPDEQLERHIVKWPGAVPKAAEKAPKRR